MPSATVDHEEISRRFIRDLKLTPHPEGGYYAVTYVDETTVASPFAENHALRPVASVIFYLLAPHSLRAQDVMDVDPSTVPKLHRSHAGYFHTNKSTTSHTWHSGRAVYTLIRIEGGQHEIRTVVMGPNVAEGEQMQLIVPRGWWKRSETSSHCLISETVCPAWSPDEHAFLDRSRLAEMFGKDHPQLVEQYAQHCLPEGLKIFS